MKSLFDLTHRPEVLLEQRNVLLELLPLLVVVLVVAPVKLQVGPRVAAHLVAHC